MKVIYNFQKAKVVLDLIVLMEQENDEMDISVQCYQNCREQGFEIVTFSESELKYRRVTFSENRNSDNIVIYLDNNHPSGISEEAYKSAKYFGCNDYVQAAEYCINHLKGVK